MNLDDYALLMNDEYGEMCLALVRLSRYGYAMRDETAKAINDEVKYQLEHIKENTHIEQETRTHEHTFDVLVWDKQ